MTLYTAPALEFSGPESTAAFAKYLRLAGGAQALSQRSKPVARQAAKAPVVAASSCDRLLNDERRTDLDKKALRSNNALVPDNYFSLLRARCVAAQRER